MSKTDVVVVGAGPTGLTLACELLRHGVQCRVIEELAEPVIYSKAAVVHARTVEIFDDMGVVDAFLGYAKPLSGARLHAGGELVARIGFEGIASRFPHVYGASQHDTELVLSRHFASAGGVIERGRKLESFEQSEDGVTVHVAGSAEAIEARFIVGCDGAHSAVRKALGFTFEGSSYEEHLIQADVHVDFTDDADKAAEDIRLYLSPAGPLAMFPLFKDGRYRLIVILMPGTPEPETTLDVFQRFVDERGPPGTRLHDPAWSVAFRIHCRRTDRYRDRRAFIAGDAAHIHSPAGGQGMNTGIQDAYNLAWKLALGVRGRATGALLDSYEAERQPVAKALLASTDAATRGLEVFAALKNPVATAVRNRVMGFVTGLDAFQARFTRQLSMIEIHYPDSPIVAEDRPSLLSANVLGTAGSEAPSLIDWMSFGEGPAPGDRAADLPLDGGVHLDALFRGTKHTLLLFDGAAPTPEGYERLDAIASRIEAGWADLVATHVVVPYDAKPAALRGPAAIVCDATGAFHRRFGARSESVYLIRPDGYVAYRSQPADGNKLEAYLRSVLLAAP